MQDPERPLNRLSRESSPYLLLHARNPVDWYPWGEEAFERARREDKPIFLSVGYSTCYWCHVMERESFSDEAVARQLNEGFVAVKLDREERPDLDEIYMTATQLLTRSGGWPNSLFLTHDLEPFFAGTYFPPDDRHGRPGFPRVLAAVREAWVERRDGVLEQAAAVAEAVRRQMADSAVTDALPPAAVVSAAQAYLARRFDREWGGFGDAPKFPSPAGLFFLLDRAREDDDEAREMLLVTLERMARGGLQDQLAGGFHRYSTDAFWLVPHFEKMLYDNAALGLLYSEAARMPPPGDGGEGGARRGEFERVARATFDFVLGELTGGHGAFLSAIDAETDGHEGAYYTWTAEELRAVLGDGDSLRLLGAVYGFDGAPNFEHDRYVLHLPRPWHKQARLAGLDEPALRARVEAGRRALAAARARRVRPLTDDKVLADWNGLMIAALARGGALLGEPRYVAAAVRAAEFVLTHLRDEAGELRHTWRDARARVPALLDDYAFLIDGLLALHAAAGEPRWLDEALRVQAEQDRRLGDEAGGGFWSAAAGAHLLVRARSAHDGALPSGNGVAALNLLALHARTGEPAWRERAERAVRAFGRAIEQFPLAHVTLVRALERLRRGASAAGVAPGEPVAPPLAAQARDVVAAEAFFDAQAPGAFKPLRVELRVRAGWHVNAHPASEPFLVATRVAGAGVRALRYPPGRELRSDLAREPLAAYAGHVTITGEVEVATGGAAPIEITFQPCDATRCLPAVTLQVTPRAAEA